MQHDLPSRFDRRPTRQIQVGTVAVGGDAPISVQSMTTTKTADVEGTLAQIYALAAAGADIVRCTCNEIEAAEALAHIVPRSPVPIVADIHHQYRMALAALEAGVDCLRLNPGNIRKPAHIKAVAEACRDRGVPIRIGVNGGSLDPDLYDAHGGRVTPEAMVESARRELAFFHEVGFADVMQALQTRAALVREWELFLEDYPVVLCPVSGELPFEQQIDVRSEADFARVYEAQLTQRALAVMGMPVLSVATGSADGRPVGVQLVGPRFREDILFAAGREIEAAGAPVTVSTPDWG